MTTLDALILYTRKGLREDWDAAKDQDDEQSIIEMAALCGFDDLVQEFLDNHEQREREQKEKFQ